MIARIKLLMVAAIAAVFLASSIPAQARDRDRDDRKCQQKIYKAEERLEQAVRKHGPHSRQTEQRRRKLEETREKCRHDRDRDRDRYRH